MMMITGATGFVGKALIRFLNEKGIEHIELGRRPSSDNANFIKACTFSDQELARVSMAGVEVVVHLAAHVHVTRPVEGDHESFDTVNVDGTRALAEFSARSGVKRFVYLSTIKVNGEQTWGKPFNEYTPLEPQGAYAESKANAERVLADVAESTGMEIVIIRPPLIYGPYVKANFLTLLQKVDRGIPLPFRAINNRRSLVYVENLIDAVWHCATHSAAANQVYMVTDGESVSSPELVKRIAVALDRPVRLFYLPLSLLRLIGWLIGKSEAIDRVGQSLEADDTKIRRELGWQPPHTMQQGLRATASWLHSRKSWQK